VADAAFYREVAALHADNLQQGFLATLGIGFLAQMYRAIDDAPESILLHEIRNGRVAGFVTGARGMGAIYKRMLRHPFALGLALLPSLLRPRRVLRIVEILRYSRDTASNVERPAEELLSLAVDPAWRGTGVAESLYRRLEAEFRARGAASFCIVVGGALAPAHRFYRRMGAQAIAQIEVHRGEASTLYLQALDRPAE
jgi:ribosomal protein S18 acetylase RimI-like enzyme